MLVSNLPSVVISSVSCVWDNDFSCSSADVLIELFDADLEMPEDCAGLYGLEVTPRSPMVKTSGEERRVDKMFVGVVFLLTENEPKSLPSGALPCAD